MGKTSFKKLREHWAQAAMMRGWTGKVWKESLGTGRDLKMVKP